MEFYQVILILVVGTVAGFMNSVGGGGSLLTLPMLIFLGLPSTTANGTNRVALVVQNIAAVLSFKSKGVFDIKLNLWLGIPVLIGSLVGANFAVSLPDEIFNRILAVVMLLVLGVILWQPHKKYLNGEEENWDTGRKIKSAVVFFLVGIYSGFIQAGVGFIIIAALSIIAGMSLVKINSVKVFIIGVSMFFSLLIFVYHGNVDWVLGFTLAIGNGLGGWLGAKFSVEKGDVWIRRIITVSVIAMSIKLFIS